MQEDKFNQIDMDGLEVVPSNKIFSPQSQQVKDDSKQIKEDVEKLEAKLFKWRGINIKLEGSTLLSLSLAVIGVATLGLGFVIAFAIKEKINEKVKNLEGMVGRIHKLYPKIQAFGVQTERLVVQYQKLFPEMKIIVKNEKGQIIRDNLQKISSDEVLKKNDQRRGAFKKTAEEQSQGRGG